MAPRWGQLFLVGLPGPEFDGAARHLVVDLQVGGIILFRRNIQEADQLTALIRQAQEAARQAGNPPLWVAVDQEGGPVQRLRAPFPETPAARTLGATATPEEVAAQARRVGMALRQLGINVNLAPVLDVARTPACPLWERSYGSTPEQVTAFGLAALQGYRESGVLPVVKHFPGLGNTTVDSHVALPRKGLEQDLEPDLAPFRQAVAAGVPGIMVAHLQVAAWDELPASLSPVAVTRMLRRQLGFSGLVFSDDLDMGAIRSQWSLPEAARLGVLAGLDQLLVCERWPELDRVIAALKQQPDLLPYLQAAWERLMRAKKTWLGS